MVKWEHMKAMDYLREPSTKSGGKRGGAESRAVVFRGVGAGSGVGPGPVMDLKSEMTAVTEVSFAFLTYCAPFSRPSKGTGVGLDGFLGTLGYISNALLSVPLPTNN